MFVSFLENWINLLWQGSPMRLIVEVGLIAFIIVLLLRPQEPPKDPSNQLTEDEENLIINEWKPQPIVPDVPESADQSILNPHVVSSGPSDKIVVDNKEVLNFGVANFLGLGMNKEIIDTALAAIDRYAVGTCGPRQFYGTMDAHLNLESELAKFFGTEDAVNYCYPFATTASVVQAFIHRPDIAFIDEDVWYAAKLGSELTHAKIIFFKHNNMKDLREKVEAQKKSFTRWSKVNRWIVVEGIYQNDGVIVNLPELIQIKKEFCLRTIIDETYSFGVLGKSGRGVLEHFDIPRSEVEVSIGSLGPSFGSLGGFTIGSTELSSFQRLSSYAYIFSASPPCFNVTAGTKAIQIVENDGQQRIEKLRRNTKMARNAISTIKGFEVLGSPESPVIHLRLAEPKSIPEENILLERIVGKALEKGVAITKSKYVDTREQNHRPTIKIFISEAHSQDEIENAIENIKKSAEEILQ